MSIPKMKISIRRLSAMGDDFTRGHFVQFRLMRLATREQCAELMNDVISKQQKFGGTFSHSLTRTRDSISSSKIGRSFIGSDCIDGMPGIISDHGAAAVSLGRA